MTALKLKEKFIKEQYDARALDVSMAIITLIIAAPLVAVSCLLIKLTSKGPVLFKQERVGINGTLFTMYKLRTMAANAELAKNNILHLNESSGPTFKIKNDPRITFVGRYLRKFSIDELPQLINVLKGEMSIVGPRPSLPKEVAEYASWQLERLSVKPGLTCIWQVSGRNKIGFNEWMAMDVSYIQNRCLRLDLLLIIKTIKIVLIKPNGM